jgi:peptidoglycan/xylan/chitin deacetylase (PgdA/CDA1 family)
MTICSHARRGAVYAGGFVARRNAFRQQIPGWPAWLSPGTIRSGCRASKRSESPCRVKVSKTMQRKPVVYLLRGSSQSVSVIQRTVVNITVHGIAPTSRELDPDEDQTWVSVEQFEQLLDAVVERPDVRITFDDGNASDVEVALPRLVERGLTAEFFLLAGLLGERGRVDHAGVRALMDAGMAIGSHGWSHRDWRRMDQAQARQELSDAHRVLSELTRRPVSRVAIPFGSYDRHVLRLLRSAGVTRAYTSDGGRTRPDAWLQARTSLRHDMDAAWIAGALDSDTSLALRARGSAARAVKRLRGGSCPEGLNA